MPRLFLYRHCKAEPGSSGIEDFDRPLASRGHAAAALIADGLAARDLLPRRIACSAALRTRETLAGLLPALGDGTTILISRDLYEPAAGSYVPVIGRFGDGGDLMIVGHNPAIQATALHYAGSGDMALRTALAGKYPTGGLAVVDFPADVAWNALPPGGGTLFAFITPASLGGDND